jgi:hypothetical protein
LADKGAADVDLFPVDTDTAAVGDVENIVVERISGSIPFEPTSLAQLVKHGLRHIA